MEKELRCGLGVRERMLRLWNRRGIMNKVSLKSESKDNKPKVIIKVYDSGTFVDNSKVESVQYSKWKEIITDITAVFTKLKKPL